MYRCMYVKKFIDDLCKKLNKRKRKKKKINIIFKGGVPLGSPRQ